VVDGGLGGGGLVGYLGGLETFGQSSLKRRGCSAGRGGEDKKKPMVNGPSRLAFV